jgi:hypothetical protein
MSGIAGIAAVILLGVTALTLFLSQDWRVSVAALAVQYAGVAVLVGMSWPVALAVVKVVVGWMAAAALGLTQIGQPFGMEERSWPGGRIFRSVAASLVLLVILTISPGVSAWFPGVRNVQVIGGLILIGMGLLHLGMTARPLRVILGLLTVLSGFEIFYAVVETSVLVAGLLVVVTLGLALVGAYLLTATVEGEQA